VVGCSYWDIFIGTPQVYAGPLANGDVAVVIVNWGGSRHGSFEFELSQVGISSDLASSVAVRDLWLHEDIGVVSGKIRVESIPPHGNYAYRLSFNKSNKFME
jgi:hypothetical protein